MVAGTIVYFWYDGKLPFLKGKSFSLMNITPTDLSSLARKTENLVKNLKSKTDLTAKNVLKTVAEKPKEIASNVVNDAKKSAVESFKNQVAEVVGITPAGSVVAENSAVKNIAIVRPVSQGLSLLVESNEENIKYSIDWGDGEKTAGDMVPKQQKTLDHIWKSAGDYSVQIEIENQKDKQKKSFVFPMKILK